MNLMHTQKVCVLIAACLMFIALPLGAQSVWTGTATVSRYGEFPDTGNYAASNSFQKNTLIEVTNLENGRRTTVIVVGRLDDPGLFLLVSRDAGDDLDIGRGEIVQVRTSLAQADSLVRAAAEDRPYSQDPDINPAATVSGGSEPAISSDPGRQVEETAIAAAPEPEVTTEPETVETEQSTGTEGTAVETETETEQAEVTPTGPTAGEIVSTGTPEGETGILATDEPEVPGEEVAAVTPLRDVEEAPNGATPAFTRVAEPPVEPAEYARVLGVLPEPQLDETEQFVLLSEPDEPAVPAADEARTAEAEEAAPSVVTLDEPAERSEDAVFVVAPPEPAFVEHELQEPETEQPEDLLVSVPLEAPPEPLATNGADAIASIEEPEPELPEPVVVDLPRLEGPAGEDEAALSSLVYPEPETPSVDLLAEASAAEDSRVAALDEELQPEEPSFELEDSEETSDVARVDEIRMTNPPATDEMADLEGAVAAAPEIAEAREGATESGAPRTGPAAAVPPTGDDVEIVLEPAEPRPPQPVIEQPELAAGEPAETVGTAEGEAVSPGVREPDIG